jgi:undecaprenyl-diphosphatase
MTLFHAFFLGILQGVTEFLPVSSSGHLVLAEQLLGIHVDPKDMQGLNIMLHAGTLLALLIIYAQTWVKLLTAPFRKDKKSTNMIVLLLLATIPAGVVGLLFEDVVAAHFQSLLSIGLAFLVTGLVLLLGECCKDGSKTLLQKLLHPRVRDAESLTVRSALAIGCAQALALIPGLSRSGLTISTGRMMGLNRKEALDFSFLMVVPVIGGATLLTLKDTLQGIITLPTLDITTAAVSASFVSSVLSILFLRRYIVHRGLGIFAPYLIIVSVLTIFLAVIQ